LDWKPGRFRADSEEKREPVSDVDTAAEETLTYYAFPEEHWRRIRTNNLLEIAGVLGGAFWARRRDG
jgi:uncharacterized protein YbcC (UPF0753/DUF2309 family)